MNRKKVLIRNFVIALVAFLIYLGTCLSFFVLSRNEEFSAAEKYASTIFQNLESGKATPEDTVNLTSQDPIYHLSFFQINDTVPSLDNEGYYGNKTGYIPQQQDYAHFNFNYDEFFQADCLSSTYFVRTKNVYLRVNRRLSSSYLVSKGLCLYGTLGFLAIDIVFYILAYYLFKRSLRPLKLQVSKLQDVVKKNHEIEFEDDLDYLTAMIRDSRHALKHELEENQIGSQKIEFILDSFSEGLIVIDSSYRVIILNKKTLSIFKKERADVEQRYLNTLGVSHELEVNFSMVIHTKKQITFIEKIDGRVYQCDINPIDYAWTRDEATNQQVGASLLLIDITDEYNSGEMKKEFFANASHELKSPLTSILGYLQLIENGTIKGKDASLAIQKCIDDANRMNKIISDMLSLSSLERESLRPIEEISLPSAIQAILSSLNLQIEIKKIVVQTNLEPMIVKMNPDDFDKMARNLIDNGIKYNKEGGKLLISSDKKLRILTIEDNGIGIAEENVPRVFERFFRVDKARSRRNGGTGLGLAIVKHICNYYDLDITLDSALGKGSRFTIHFPE